MTEQLGVVSLVDAYNALGLPKRKVIKLPEDASPEAIAVKITNPQVFKKLGLPEDLARACEHAELAANLLDVYSETGYPEFLYKADEEYQRFLQNVPEEARPTMRLIAAWAMGYFHLEQYYAQRVRRRDQFTEEEIVHYHLARGSDSVAYGEIARLAGQATRGLVSGFRIRQALWDLGDEVTDLIRDVKEGLGVNIIRMSRSGSERGVRRLAGRFYRQAKYLDLPKPLREEIDQEYGNVMSLVA